MVEDMIDIIIIFICYLLLLLLLFVSFFLYLFSVVVDSIVYIPAGDAAIYRQSSLMTQLAQDMDSNASVVKPSSSSSTTMTR